MSQYVALRATSRSARVRVPSRVALGTPQTVAVAAVGSGGTFAAATYFWKIVAVNASGHSVASAEVSKAIVLNGSASLTWDAVTGATSYQIWRGTSTGAEDHFQTSSTNSFTDTGTAGTAGTLPATVTGVTTGFSVLKTTSDTVVDLDDAGTRLALVRHSAIRQWYVSAVNNTSGVTGSKSALPSNS